MISFVTLQHKYGRSKCSCMEFSVLWKVNRLHVIADDYQEVS